MARKPGTRTSGEFALFDVVYEDGTQRSNRRVPVAVLGGLDDDEDAARAAISEQDSAIAEKSGVPPSASCRCGAPRNNARSRTQRWKTKRPA